MNSKNITSSCLICGEKSFSWGHLAGAIYQGEKPYRRGLWDRIVSLTSGGFFTIRLCNNCGNAQLFDAKVIDQRNK